MNSRNHNPAKAIDQRKKLREGLQEADPQSFSEYPLSRPLGKFVDEVMEGKPKPTELRLPGISHDDGTTTSSMDAKDSGEPFWEEMADDYRRKTKDANGLVALIKGLRTLAVDPEIVAGRESGAFIAGLLSEVEDRYPGELLALLPGVDRSLRGLNHNAARADRGPHMAALELLAWELYKKGPQTGKWKNRYSHAAKTIEKEITTAAHKVGWKREITPDSYKVLIEWIKEKERLHST